LEWGKLTFKTFIEILTHFYLQIRNSQKIRKKIRKKSQHYQKKLVQKYLIQ